jgi:hypothetical protein
MKSINDRYCLAEGMRSRLARIASIKTADRAIAAPFPAAMETMRAGYWKLVLRVAINKHRSQISSSARQMNS